MVIAKVVAARGGAIRHAPVACESFGHHAVALGRDRAQVLQRHLRMVIAAVGDVDDDDGKG